MNYLRLQIQKNIITIRILAVFFVAMFFVIYFNSNKPDEILLHKGFSHCRFIQWVPGSKGSYEGSIKYSFEYHYKFYVQHIPAYNCSYNTMIGKYFLIVFDTLNPGYSHVLIGPKDYRYAGMAFPDSMKWVYSLCDTAYTH
jgi:hypothetical protein